MTDETSIQTENFYAVLQCNKTATYDQLKHNYQRLIREFHPDKQVSSGTQDFVLIDKAWKVLRDETSRKNYDASLLQSDFSDQPLIYAELDKRKVQFNSDNESYYPCRCGNKFVICREYLDEHECFVECSECSNCIVIK